MRPNFFVNTPDINPVLRCRLQRPARLPGRAPFWRPFFQPLLGRCTAASSFAKARPIPGKEEYLDSEKYEIKRVWDWDRPGNITRRRRGSLTGCGAENPALVADSRTCASTGLRGTINVLVFMQSSRMTLDDFVRARRRKPRPEPSPQGCPIRGAALASSGSTDNATIDGRGPPFTGTALRSGQGKTQHVWLPIRTCDPYAIWTSRTAWTPGLNQHHARHLRQTSP